MQNLPVHWYEGAFIRPQHFQAHERHWAELMSSNSGIANPHNYGIAAINFSREALANQQFELRSVLARMRDGTLIDLGIGENLDRVDLSNPLQMNVSRSQSISSKDLAESFERETSITVYLGVPKRKLGRTNVGSSDSPNANELRHLECDLVLPDESWGGEEQEVQLKRLNVQLLVSTQDLSGYELLPIARVKRAGEGE